MPLGAWLNARTTASAEAKAERDNLGAQFDAMLLAVTQLRAAVDEDRILWSNWREKLSAIALAAMSGAGLAAFIRGSDHRQIAAAMGGASWFLTQERAQQKTASSSITPKIAAVAQAAAPLLRHSDRDVQDATKQLMTAAFRYHEAGPAELDTAMDAFGTALRAAMQHPAQPRRAARARRTTPGEQ
ncbi:hypothetical protein ACFOOM_12190 [Streptomyces echinoruber]|uniref:hypothetical protein n=1 Tax=Streptomyces echinoruber TaxID=68898 RepID=UPI00167E713C|nr:hypothetical protein [Streptomyces echinoruber]